MWYENMEQKIMASLGYMIVASLAVICLVGLTLFIVWTFNFGINQAAGHCVVRC